MDRIKGACSLVTGGGAIKVGEVDGALRCTSGAGRIAVKDHVVEGLANAPEHLLLAMRGDNFGRPLVKL